MLDLLSTLYPSLLNYAIYSTILYRTVGYSLVKYHVVIDIVLDGGEGIDDY